MQNLQLISTKELRDNLAEILEKVAIGKQSFLVSKFGREKALITPVTSVSASKFKKVNLAELPAFGMWRNRKDMKDAASWVSKLRIKQSQREA